MGMAKHVRTKITLDDQLTEHLKQAETHLIEAVTLFNERRQLTRRRGYYTRLVNAQESVTTLYREELVRERGPQRRPQGLTGGRRGRRK